MLEPRGRHPGTGWRFCSPSVSPGLEQRLVDAGQAADHLRDGDRLPEGAAETEQHRRR